MKPQPISNSLVDWLAHFPETRWRTLTDEPLPERIAFDHFDDDDWQAYLSAGEFRDPEVFSGQWPPLPEALAFCSHLQVLRNRARRRNAADAKHAQKLADAQAARIAKRPPKQHLPTGTKLQQLHDWANDESARRLIEAITTRGTK